MKGHFVAKTAVSFVVLCAAVLMAACEQSPESTSATASAEASAAQVAVDNSGPEMSERSVVAETLAYAEVDDHLVKGHFVFPEDMIDSLPAIILIHEWWGLDDRTRALADRIAAQGFVVLAIDLYGGEIATSSPEARSLMLKVVEEPQDATQNIRLAYDWLLSTSGATQVGVVGYGFGGGWSLTAAIELPEKLDAAVMFYGQVSEDGEALVPITAPLLGFFGSADNSISAESVARFELALQNLGKVHEIEVYADAKGGFASSGHRNFDPDLALKSWDRMIVFLHTYLTKAEVK